VEERRDLYSVRMRAAEGAAHEQGGRHISGGERLVCGTELEEMVQGLVRRALTHERGRADFIRLTVERVAPEAVRTLPALPVRSRPCDSADAGRALATQLLMKSGVSPEAAEEAVRLLADGANPDGGVMRGAVVMDAQTGERLERDRRRGVRVSKVDWRDDAGDRWLERAGLCGPHEERILEALALATKVASVPGTVAELCWSDDPSYVTGYVASQALGYVRITPLKERGDGLGGRVYLVRGVDLDAYEKLLTSPCLVTDGPMSEGEERC